jgi:rubrerythrin
MADLSGTKTHENLKAAFTRGSEANRRYLWFAQQADIEGRPEIAALFRAVADAETSHAFGHLDHLVDVGDPASGEPIGATDENLRVAVSGEIDDATVRYPAYARTARDEGFADIADWFESVARDEESHAVRFTDGLEAIS